MTIEEQIRRYLTGSGGKGKNIPYHQFKIEMNRLKRIFRAKLTDAMDTYTPIEYQRTGRILDPDLYKIDIIRTGNSYIGKLSLAYGVHHSWDGVKNQVREQAVPILRILSEGYETRNAWHSHIPYFGWRPRRGGYRIDFIRATIDEFNRKNRFGIVLTVENIDMNK